MTPRKGMPSPGPLVLLLASGLCLGTIFPLAKLAAERGVSAVVYAGGTAVGACLVLALMSLWARLPLLPDREELRYSLIAGLLTFAIPWGTVVVVIANLGAALPAIVQTLTPIITLGLVYVLGLEKPRMARVLGLGLGIAGAVIILVARDTGTDDSASRAPLFWYAAALVTPTVLAIGNVFRTVSWPASNPTPMQLATWSLAAAAAAIAGVQVLLGPGGAPLTAQLAAGWPLILVQSLATGVGYALFFKLQRIGGSVYVSQLSYVNTAVGLLCGVLLFAEPLSRWSWIALALTIAGIFIVNATSPGNRKRI